jgi:RNA polymerase sigma factor (sigma-70 family)
MESHCPPDVRSAGAAELLHRCASADPLAANAAFQELGRFLLRIACARLKDQPHLAHVAEDCAQQALVIVWRKLHAGQGPDRPEWFTTWCAGIVIHRVLDELRRLGRSRLDSLEDLTFDGESELPAGAAAGTAYAANLAPGVSASDFSFATAEDRGRFIALIENHPRLSADVKLVLLHGYLLERDDQELADQLGKSRATVRVLRFRGLQTLRADGEFMTQVAALTHAEPSLVRIAAGD